jgi:hypothetical protein
MPRSVRRSRTRFGAPFAAFAWELPPFAPDSLERPAEFVVIEHPALARAVADHSPFDAALGATTPVATFPNLGGDAVLVVPHPVAAPDSAHLARFVRSASPSVADALWTAVGRALAGRLASGPVPLWLSTAGLGYTCVLTSDRSTTAIVPTRAQTRSVRPRLSNLGSKPVSRGAMPDGDAAMINVRDQVAGSGSRATARS